jgi:ATP-dependent RNA helicase HelY
LLLVSDDARLVRIGPDHLPESAAILGQIDLDSPFRFRDAAYRHRLAGRLRDWRPGGPPRRPHLLDDDLDGVAGCPDIDHHLGAARSARRTEKQLQRDRRRLESVSAGMVPRFHALLQLLGDWGYVDGWSLTGAGTRLRSIYNELDLLLTETISSGHLDGLDLAEMAAVASAFTFESRSRDEQTAGWPTRTTAQRADRIWEAWARLVGAEERLHLPPSRSPEAGFAAIAYRWASGESLEGLFEGDAFRVGDFVRNCRQLIDLLHQIGDASPELAPIARAAVGAIDRGVVAAVGIA